jgi:hypothetical protein
LYFTKIELGAGSRDGSSSSKLAAATPSSSATPAPSPAKDAVAPPPSQPAAPAREKLVAETVPFVSDQTRLTLARDYIPAGDYKAFAISTGPTAFVLNQGSEDDAKSAALEQCQKRADALAQPRKCELYAVGNAVVYAHGRPPVPPLPWIRHDPSTEKPLVVKDVPLVRDPANTRLGSVFAPGRSSKALAVGPGGHFFFTVNQDSVEEAARRALEGCGAAAGVPCMILAQDDVFVVSIPTVLKVTGFFRAGGNSAIAADARDEVARKLADASSGWNAVAVGASGRPGLALRASNEQNAVNAALGDCVKRDSECHVIAIGPFSVGPN